MGVWAGTVLSAGAASQRSAIAKPADIVKRNPFIAVICRYIRPLIYAVKNYRNAVSGYRNAGAWQGIGRGRMGDEFVAAIARQANFRDREPASNFQEVDLGHEIGRFRSR